MKTIRWTFSCIALLSALSASAQTGGGFDLTWNRAGGGLPAASGGGFQIRATIGQAAATASGGAFALESGFWPAFSVGAPPIVIVSANPPTDNPYVAGQQPYRDVLDTGATPALTAGIGGNGTLAQGSVTYSPISVTFSATPSPAPAVGNVTVACTGGVCPTVTSVTGSGTGPYSITLSGAIPPGQCTTITFAGTQSPGGGPPGSLSYQSQPGNVSMDATTNTQDMLTLVQALNNGSANLTANMARYNVNRSTGANPVNTQDLLRLIQLLNGVNTIQAFNGAGVAACP